MQKLISLFQRSFEEKVHARNEVVPGAEWVLAGEGVATRKFDGTCCKMENGVLFKRYDAKKGRNKPKGFIPAQDPDPITGHWPGWVEVGSGPEDHLHREVFDGSLPDGTYELCGPKVSKNPEGCDKHVLIPHGSEVLNDCPRDFEGLKQYFEQAAIEGVVWHHSDGRMVKIKARDFGIKRQCRAAS